MFLHLVQFDVILEISIDLANHLWNPRRRVECGRNWDEWLSRLFCTFGVEWTVFLFVRVIMDDPRKLSREPCPANTSPSQLLVSLDVTLGVLWECIVSLFYICICVSVGIGSDKIYLKHTYENGVT